MSDLSMCFEGAEVRLVVDDLGAPWWVGHGRTPSSSWAILEFCERALSLESLRSKDWVRPAPPPLPPTNLDTLPV